jgi:chromate reductase
VSALRDIVVIVGSLRKESFNRKLALAAIDIAPPELKLAIVEIGELPMYNQDFEGPAVPAAFTGFRERVRRADGVLFFTPEYNRSVPGVLKNAIDVGSRPYGSNAWNAKPCAVISVSTGALGAFGANHHLRQALVAVNMPTLQQPEAYIGSAEKLFDAQGKLIDARTRQFLGKILEAFAAWTDRNAVT